MITKYLPWVLLSVLVIIQFFQIEKTNPTVDPTLDFLETTQAPEKIAKLFKGACYDCHSYHTAFPAYTNFQPLAWWIRGHIRGARQNLNFSEWQNIDEKKKNHDIQESIEVIGNKRMPLKSYGWMHKKGSLTAEDRATMIDWLRTL